MKISAIVLALALSGCSQKAALEELADGPCNGGQARLVERHISDQIDALAKNQWESAYSFASPSFRSAVDIEQFIFIIGAQYAMLINNQGYEFAACSINNDQITQEVGVRSNDKVFNLTYTLTVKDSILGISSAAVSGEEAQLQA
jgi:hypothetical protein